MRFTTGLGPNLTVSSAAVENLLFVSEPFAIAVSVLLLVIAAMVLGALILHWRTFNVMLRVNPHTMAGQGVMLTRSDVAAVLDEPILSQKEMKTAMRGHRWALRGGRICFDDDADDADGQVDKNYNHWERDEPLLMDQAQ